MNTVALLLLVSTALWIIRKTVSYFQAVKSIKYVERVAFRTPSSLKTLHRSDHPGIRTLIDTRDYFADFLPRIPYVTGARRIMPAYYITSKYDLCKEHGSDIVSYVSSSSALWQCTY